MGLPGFGNQLAQRVETVYFADSTKLREGQVLCFEPLDDSAVNKPGTDDKGKDTWLGNRVAAIDAANKAYFAGIVHPSSVGKTGPGWVDIIVPQAGEFVQVEVDGDTDVAVDDSLELDTTKAAFIKDASVAAGVFPRAFSQEAVTAAAKTLTWVMFY